MSDPLATGRQAYELPQDQRISLRHSAQRTRRRRRGVGIVAAVAMLAVIGGIVGYFYAGAGPRAPVSPSGDARSPVPEATAFAARGTMEVRADYTGATTGAACQGTGGYRDMRVGAQVRVTDSTGRVVGVGQLAEGVVTEFAPFKYCVFTFVIQNIPTGGGIYAVEVSHRGKLSFPEAELRDSMVKLTLG